MTNEPTPSQDPTFTVRGQYIKDLSFENPNAPHSLLAMNTPPKIDVNVNLNARRIDNDIYETTLHLTARATSENNPLFLADLTYSGLFQLSNVPENTIEQLLMIECPFVLFPFARRVIADVTRDGGFPPLMLDPIDFHSLYAQNKSNNG